jgi:NAD(P)-dependent dehydrogenase (short-subunit alcohol dehydrogenase family)
MTAAADDLAPVADPLVRFRIDGRVAVVTGASSGLGVRFAEVLDSAGARLVIVARRAERLHALAARLRDAHVVAADVTRPAEVEAVAAATVERFGRVDILVNNAGISDAVPAEDEPLEQFQATVDVNLVAAFHLCQVFGRLMLAQGAGNIINVASMLGVVSAGQIPQAGYAASKAGLINLSRDLAAQWGRRGVRVNALCPGWFLSEMTSGMFADEQALGWIRRKTILGRAGRADELDGALLWLAGDASSYVTGSALIVDGGFTAT